MNIEDLIKGKFNPEKLRQEALNKTMDYTIQILFNECPEESKTELFYNDPRRSDKEKSVFTLVSKALPQVLRKLNENDLNLIFEKIQSKKGV